MKWQRYILPTIIMAGLAIFVFLASFPYGAAAMMGVNSQIEDADRLHLFDIETGLAVT
ncbi:MAG: hypothetical protein PVJ61_07800 [Dehalococcoidia bacterium]|jgi:hypothetical protein